MEHKHVVMTSDLFRYYLIYKILPAIQRTWPKKRGEVIFIQVDNARPHIPADDPEWLEAVAQTRLNVRLIFQPPNSPDTNVLDLGIFRHLERIAYNLPDNCKNVNDLVAAVQKAWENSSAQDQDKVFITLHSVLRMILQHNGGNDFEIPHMGKEAARRRLGTSSSPTLNELLQLQVPQTLVTQGTKALARHDRGFPLNPTRVGSRKRVRAPTPSGASAPT